MRTQQTNEVIQKDWRYWRKRVFEIIEIGAPEDYPSRIYDFVNLLTIVINLTVSIMYTFNSMEAKYGPVLLRIESATVVFFAVDYVLRLLTARHLRPKKSEFKALLGYMFSFTGLADMLPSFPIICRSFSRPAPSHSVCSVSCESSACSVLRHTTTPSM